MRTKARNRGEARLGEFFGKNEADGLAVRKGLVHAGQGAVVHRLAVIDQDYAFAQVFDVGKVVAGKHHGRYLQLDVPWSALEQIAGSRLAR